MDIRIHLGRRAVLLVVAGAALLAGGVAYAKVADTGGVLTACRLDSNGSLRLIDPTLSSGPLSRCTQNETQVSWNQQGQPGAAGPTGPAGKDGKDGKDGVSPTVAQLGAGDSHCAAGGASITDASGNVAYVCNGAVGADGKDGKDGAPFNGTFTSPNGQFTLTVSDAGVSIIGPDSSVSLPAGGGIDILGGDIQTVANNVVTQINHDETTHVGHDRTETVGNDSTTSIGHNDSIALAGSRTSSVGSNETITITGNRTESVHGNQTITVDASRTERVGANDSLNVGASRTERVGGQLSLLAGASATIDAPSVAVNGAGAGCKSAARVGDLVSSTAILTGSANVCIGG